MYSVEPLVTLDEQELNRKQQELESLRQTLMDRELQWATAQREAALFEQRYRVCVGGKYQELDRLKASVLVLASKVFPQDNRIRNQARSAWEALHREANEPAPDPEPAAPDPIPEPPQELKKLFRQAARQMHPDLTTDGKERERRHQLMTRLNEAYRDTDAGRVRALLEEFEARQPAKDPKQFGRRLAAVLKQIGQVRHRLFQIETDFKNLEQSDMYRLHVYHKQQVESGGDVLADMAREVDEQIQTLRNRIRNLASDCAQL